MSALDILYCAMPSDAQSATHSNRLSTLNAAALFAANGVDVTILSAPTVAWAVNSVGIIADASFSAYFIVTHVTDTTHFRIKPLQFSSDTPGVIGHTFASGVGSTLSSLPGFPRSCVSLVADLSESPLETFNYLVVGSMSARNDSSGQNIRMGMRGSSLIYDQLSGSAFSQARFTRAGTDGDRYSYVGSKRFSLTPGQRSEFHLEVAHGAAGGTATVEYGHMAALRYTSIYADATHNGDSAPETNATGAFVVSADLGNNALPAGRYLLCATWCLGTSDVTKDVEAELNDLTGLGLIAFHIPRLSNTLDRGTGGFFNLIDVGATNHIVVQHKGDSGATSTIEGVQLCAIPIAALPAFAATALDVNLVDLASMTNSSSYQTIKTSDAVSLSDGMHFEIINAGIGADDEFIARPVFRDAPNTGTGEHGAVSGFSSIKPIPTFWFQRRQRAAGSTTNAVEGKVIDATGTVAVNYTAFSWLREYPEILPTNSTPVAIIAEVENGSMELSHWVDNTDGNYRKGLDSDVEDVSRIIVDGVEHTRVETYSAPLADATWYFDYDLQRVLVPASTSPNTAGKTVLVVPLMRVARYHVDLQDSTGRYYPYEARIAEIPSIDESLDFSGGKVGSTVNRGTLKLAAGDGKFDDIVGARRYAGFRCKIKRGFPTLSDRLADFETIADCVMDEPDLPLMGGPSYLTIKLYDRGLNLTRPLSTLLFTTRSGNAGQANAATQDNQEIPVVFGPFSKLEAKRVTAIEVADQYETFKFASHGVSSITHVYYKNTEGKFIEINLGTYCQVTATYIDSGTLRVKNHIGAGLTDATQPFDVVYVDGVGRTSNGLPSGTVVQTPGAIARALVVSFPRRIDEAAGTPSTVIANSNHTSAVDGANCEVASTASFSIGDRVRVVSHAAATTFYHGFVTAVLAGPARLTLVPSYETGDAAVGTVFTFGASSVVRKTAFAGGLAATDLAEASFRTYDRNRRQLNDGVGLIPTTVNFALLCQPSETVRDALTRLTDGSGGFWRLNHAGRIEMNLIDIDAGQLSDGLGFEDSANAPAPWTGVNGGTVSIQSTQVYEGTYALELAGAVSSPNAKAVRTILVQPGWNVLLCYAKAVSGDTDYFRLGVYTPAGEIELGEAEILVTGAWRPKFVAFYVPQGFSGTAWIYVYPAEGRSNAFTTTVRVDNLEFYPFEFNAQRSNSLPTRAGPRGENFYEAQVTFAVDLQDVEHAPIVIRNDSEAKGAALGTPSEGKFAGPNSVRADLGQALIPDLASAAGIAGAVASRFARAGQILDVDVLAPARMPSVGRYLFHERNPRIPTLENRYPIHRIKGVKFAKAMSASVEAERLIDPMNDRNIAT